MIQSVFSTISQAASTSVATISRDADRQPPRDEPEQPVEDKAVDDVRGRIPVGEVLRILRAHRHAVPELHVAACADRRAPHEEQDQRGERDDAEGEGEMAWRQMSVVTFARHLLSSCPDFDPGIHSVAVSTCSGHGMDRRVKPGDADRGRGRRRVYCAAAAPSTRRTSPAARDSRTRCGSRTRPRPCWRWRARSRRRS